MQLPSPLPRHLPPIWRESRTGIELAGLLCDPLYRRPEPATGGGRQVLLLPGFLAGDDSLVLLSRWLDRSGYRPIRAGMRSNVGCAKSVLDRLEAKLESEIDGSWRRIAIVGHSHGGTLGRSLAIRRPDLVSGVVALGSPLVDQLALHPLARRTVRIVGGLGSLGTPGLFRRQCLDGECCSEIHDGATTRIHNRVGFVTVYSRSDGVVDWQSCLDPRATPVEINSSHVGMAVNAQAYRAVADALRGFDARRRRRPRPEPAAAAV